jgi:methylenetetrahydrofolate reductase (NADPH)
LPDERRHALDTLRHALVESREFAVTCELIPGRGHKGRSIDAITEFVHGVRSIPQVKALSITDNAGGNPALSADILSFDIHADGTDILVHFACKDMNRNFVESRAYALARRGIRNLLVITGDFPISGFFGVPKPVFDIDSVSALHYLRLMNEGLEVEGAKGKSRLERTDFFLGAVVSPFKWTEGPAMMQYCKLEKKLAMGADFIVTQLGYDMRKLRELITYVRTELGSPVPLMGSVYVLTAGAAALMNRGEIPGCWASDELLARLREEAKEKDKGKQKRLERAARMVAILRGLGYNGTHIEGLALKVEDVDFIVRRSEDIGENWRDHAGELLDAPKRPFFYFAGGERVDFHDHPAGRPAAVSTTRKRILSPSFWIMRLTHKAIFTPGTLGYRFMVGFSHLLEKRRGLHGFFRGFEHVVKRALFGCRYCDDCALFEMFYVCPEARCPKGMRIGPCGGGRIDGGCEVFPERMCIWHHVYWRAKNRRALDTLKYLIPPRNWKLYETSSWMNYFLKYDHSGTKIELPARSAAAAGQSQQE